MKKISLMKQLVAGILTAALVASMATVTSFAADGEFRLSVDATTASPGDTVIAMVNATNLTFASAQFDVEYDPAVLEYNYLRLADGVRGLSVKNNDSETGVIHFAFVVTFDQTVNSAFVNVGFTVKEDAPANASTYIRFTTPTAVATIGTDEDGNPIGDGKSHPVDFSVGTSAVTVTIK